jgi:Spy/CpxP family protein refolding chaperone
MPMPKLLKTQPSKFYVGLCSNNFPSKNLEHILLRENTMKSKYSIFITVAAVALMALTVPAPAFSKMTGMGHMDKMSDMMEMCVEHADKMGLTNDQIAQMKPVHNEMQKKQVRFKADLKIAELELMEIMEVKNFDIEKAGAAINKISERITSHHMEMLKAMKEMRTVLTNEQFAKMKTMMAAKPDHKKPQKDMKKDHKK